jgi:hypothetical protein
MNQRNRVMAEVGQVSNLPLIFGRNSVPLS